MRSQLIQKGVLSLSIHETSVALVHESPFVILKYAGLSLSPPEYREKGYVSAWHVIVYESGDIEEEIYKVASPDPSVITV
ncbi:hypothetical protein [Terriglobus roseus]|uniref:hypothetical protein n=1 Tax=Terriglobus roseus TaxID=392734 RepID=UPI0009F34F2A|nr:hypothetical protein [Terriglobus roseus]